MAQQDDRQTQHPAAGAPMVVAVHANLFQVQALGGQIKITFGQEFLKGAGIAWFSAVTLTLADGQSLEDALRSVIEAAERQQLPPSSS